MATVLVAEIEQRTSSLVRKGLSRVGLSARVVTDGLSAYRQARCGEADVVLLAAALPRMDGFEVLRRLRSGGSDVPVVMMLERQALWDSVARVRGAADGYVVKPFCFKHLHATITRVLRSETESEVLCHNDLRLDTHARRAHIGEYWIRLSARECAMAELFLRHPGETLTREELHHHVWGDEEPHTSNLVDLYVGYLRRKLGAHRITSHRGIGYRLELEL